LRREAGGMKLEAGSWKLEANMKIQCDIIPSLKTITKTAFRLVALSLQPHASSF